MLFGISPDVAPITGDVNGLGMSITWVLSVFLVYVWTEGVFVNAHSDFIGVVCIALFPALFL